MLTYTKDNMQQMRARAQQMRARALKWWESPVRRGQAEFHGTRNSDFRAYSARKVRERLVLELLKRLASIPDDAINVCIIMQIVGEPVEFTDVESARDALCLATQEVKRLKIRTSGRRYDLPSLTSIQYDRPVPKTVTAPAYISGGCCCDGDSAVICLDGEGKTISVLRGNGYSHEAASGGTMGLYRDDGTVYSVPEGTAAIVSYSADTINGGRKSADYMFGDRRIAEKAIKEYRSSTSLWW